MNDKEIKRKLVSDKVLTGLLHDIKGAMDFICSHLDDDETKNCPLCDSPIGSLGQCTDSKNMGCMFHEEIVHG